VLVEWIAAGLVAGQLLATGGWVGGAAAVPALGACLLFMVIARRRAAARTVATTLAAGLAGAILAAHATAIPDDGDHVARLALPLRARVIGRVAARPVSDDRRTIVLLDVTQVGTRPRTWGRVRLRVRGRPPLAPGDLVAVETTLRRPRNFENPGRFDMEGLLARQGIHVVASVWDANAIERRGRTPTAAWTQTLDTWRAAVRAAVAAGAGPEVAGVLVALVLGDESGIAAGLRDAFTRAGVVHVLSVSGLHVGIVTASVAGLLAWLLGRNERVLLHLDRRKLAVTGGLGAAMLYGALAGFAIATVRSVVMAGVVAAAVLLDRRAEPMRALALAAILVVATQPGAPADISFQLSFASVGALLLGAARDESAAGLRWSWLRRAARAAAVAWIGTAPLTAFHFHQVSLVSVFANPLVVPLFEGVSLLPALGGALLAPVAPALAAAAFTAAAVPVRAALAIVECLGAWSWAAVDVPLPSVGELAMLYGAIGGAWYRRSAAGRLLMAVCLTALAIDAAGWASTRFGRTPRATFLDVGQGDAAVVELANGRVLAVDAGGFPGSDFDTGAAIVEPFLRTRKIQRIDVVVMSHAHPDHAGGLAHLLRRFPTGELWWSGLGGVGAAWDDIVAALRETGTPVRILRAGDAIPEFPEVAVLHPPPDWTTASLNEGSLVIRVRVGSTAVLLTGDAERAAEATMSSRPERLAAGVLKVPHHGSRTSSSGLFIAAVDPAVAVMSLGADNRFAHPAPEVTARYARHGVVAYRTDRCGAVTVEPDGDGLRIRTSRPACASAALPAPPPRRELSTQPPR